MPSFRYFVNWDVECANWSAVQMPNLSDWGASHLTDLYVTAKDQSICRMPQRAADPLLCR